MWKNIKKGMFPFLIGFSALSVSGSAAFYSVFGLSKLFAGASTEVIIMAGSLEFAKLVTASLLYQYWNELNKFFKYYLTLAAIILILITSMGIYGFLSAAYQDTYQKLLVSENQIEFLEEKASFYEEDITRYDQELDQILANITTLSNAKSQSIQVKDTSVAGGVRNTISTAELRLSQARIEVEEENRKAVNLKREEASKNLQDIRLEILELQNDSETVGELGPLKYLAGLTDTPMDKIINILLLVIIFVFDPLAVSLVIAANFAFVRAFPPKNYEDTIYGEKEEVKKKITLYSEEDNKRMEIIGQNGNDGIHYDDIETPEERKAERVKAPTPAESRTDIDRVLQKGPSKWRVKYKDGTEGWIERAKLNLDNNTKKYYF